MTHGPASETIKEWVAQGDRLFNQRMPLMSLWQEQADNFYPERADFTWRRSVGNRLTGQLTTSHPMIVRRDAANLVSVMLRPMETPWFSMHTMRPENETTEDKRWLERATGIQRRAMYDPVAQMVKATKLADNDYITFGQCVLSVELNRNRDALLYRCHHLKDVAWVENYEGQVGAVYVNWEPMVSELMKIYGADKVCQTAKDAMAKDRTAKVKCRIMVIPLEDYNPEGYDNRRGKQYKHIVVDRDHMHVLEDITTFNKKFIVPRWNTGSSLMYGSQYAFSPCAVAGMPDAELLQAMSLTLLEAGEKAVSPPLIGVEEAIRSDVAIYAGGITYVDAEYDERLGEVLRPLNIDKSGLPLGIELIDRTKNALESAFFLNKLNLPPMDGGDKMTAYEVQQRISEYRRNAMPLFEPMEHEYNAQLCDVSFDLLFRAGAFGPLDQMPETLSNQDLQFRFMSPLVEAEDQIKAQKYLNAKGLIAASLDIDPTAGAVMNTKVALRDALLGTVPAKWVNSEEEVAAAQEQAAAEQQAQQALATMQQGADVAATLSEVNRNNGASM